MIDSGRLVTLDSRIVYDNPWMTVRQDSTEAPDGTRGIYGVVDKPDFAVVLPYEDGGFWLTQQFRYPVGTHLGVPTRRVAEPADRGSARARRGRTARADRQAGGDVHPARLGAEQSRTQVESFRGLPRRGTQ